MPKILLVDIETAPNLCYSWGLWKELTSTEMIEREWYVLCWCAKWLGSKEMMSSALVDFPKMYKQDSENDKLVLEKVWKLLDEADIVIGHNALEFDIKKLNARFIKHGMTPPSPFKVVDTCLGARKYFGFTSNKLGDLGKFLGLGEKLDTGGFKLWRGCMQGKLDAWKLMVKYCGQDILLLEKVYLKLRPYMENHPNLAIFLTDRDRMCPKCKSKKLQKHGFVFSNQAKYQRWLCTDCGSYARQKLNEIDKKKVKLVGL
jgi:hypothetical protein